MQRRFPIPVLVPLLAAWLLAASPAPSPELEPALREIDQKMSAATAPEAEATLKTLLAAHPDSYKAYDLYWRALKIQRKETELRASAGEAMAALGKVPKRKRSEEYYSAVLHGCSILGDKDQTERVKKEAIRRFPRGSLARNARLREAALAGEEDPVRAAALFQALIDDFSGDPDFSQMAAMSRLEVLGRHPDLFDAAALHDAAVSYEALSRKALESDLPGAPYWYVAATCRAAGVLADRWPAESLKIAARGLACFEEHWATDDAFQGERPIRFWPPMLRAYVASQDWKAAKRVGEALVREIDGGSVSPEILASLNEGRVRSDYATALETLGQLEEARLQIGLAAAAEESRRKDFDAFQARHPLDSAAEKRFRKTLSAAQSGGVKRREDRMRRDLLANEVNQPTPEFQAEDLKGRKISLASFRGKTVVLSLWATWCGACVWEMDHLEEAARRYHGNPKVTFAAVSVDWEKEKVAPFVREKKLTLPIYIAGGSLEKDFGVETIPQMFIIDPRGRMRFRLEDLLDEDHFQQSLDWLIQAAQK
jgi:peroxiredoxin